MIYSNLLINDKNWKHLTYSWFKKKLPHALLFHGPEGSGKEGHALELAALIQCSSKENKESCGTCINCKQTKSLKNISSQIIDDKINKTIVSASSTEKDMKKVKKIRQLYQ